MSGTERQSRAFEIEVAARMAGMTVEDYKEHIRGVRKQRVELDVKREERIAQMEEGLEGGLGR